VLKNAQLITFAEQLNATPAQVIFSFAREVGILPLTGTSSADHMWDDLASLDVTLPPDALPAIECAAG